MTDREANKTANAQIEAHGAQSRAGLKTIQIAILVGGLASLVWFVCPFVWRQTMAVGHRIVDTWTHTPSSGMAVEAEAPGVVAVITALNKPPSDLCRIGRGDQATVIDQNPILGVLIRITKTHEPGDSDGACKAGTSGIVKSSDFRASWETAAAKSK